MKKQKINIQTAALSTAALLGLASPALAQNVSISPTGNAPDNSAALDIRDFTDKGILIPRIALTGPTDVATIPSPALSLLVYNTGTGGLTPAGYYYWDGSRWVRLVTMGGTPSDAWLTLGNAGTNPATHFVGTTDNVALVFRTNNTEKMRITAGGNVGIGTTTPGEKVEINGRLLLDFAATPIIRLRTNVNAGGSTKGITEHRIFGPYNVASGSIGALYIAAGKSSDDTKNEIILYNNGCAGPGGTYDCNARRIRLLGDTIYASGNVGIGTIAPNRKLELVNDVSGLSFEAGTGSPNSGVIRFGNNSGWKLHFGRSRNSAGGPLNSGTAGVLMTIQDNGNVGIGTTAPSEKLEILGGGIQLNDTMGIGFNADIPYKANVTGDRARIYYDWNFFGIGTDALVIEKTDVNQVDPDGGIVFTNKGSDNIRDIAMTIRGSGNVGIGTTTPGAKLQIAGGAVRLDAPQGAPYGYSIRIGSGWGSWARAYGFHSSADAELAAFGAYGSGNTLTYAFIGPGATAHNSPWMVITNTGNVGIGTTTPSQKLSVVGNICATGNINGNSATCGSDIRWKKDLKPLENTLEKISQLKPVYYYWKKDEFPDKHFTDKRQIGLIAQDMQKVFPELVVEDKEGYLSVDYSRFTSVLLKAIQEQQQIIHEQQQQIQEQQQQIHDQQKIIQELQAENAQIKAENAQIKAENAQIKTENAQTKSELKALAEKMNILINTLSAEKKVGNK